MIKTCKTMWLGGTKQGMTVCCLSQYKGQQASTATNLWEVVPADSCRFSKFVYAQRLDKLTLGCCATKIFGLGEYHSPYVLKRTHSLAAETSRALPWILLQERQAVPSMMCGPLDKPRDAMRHVCGVFSDVLQLFWGLFKAWSVHGVSIPSRIH